MPEASKIAPRILVPTDFSPDSERAFYHALAFAVARQGRLTLLHTGSESRESIPWDRFPGVRETLTAWGLLPQGAPQSAVLDTLKVNITKMAVRDDDPRQGITEYLRKNPTDLLVMATRGRTGLIRLRRSSVAETVTYLTNSHSLLLPDRGQGFVDPETGRASLQRVLCALAPGLDPRQALAYLQTWLTAFGGDDAEVCVLHSGNVRELALPQGERWRLQARESDEFDEVIATAREFEPDLVITSTQGPQGLKARIRGSHTDRLLCELGSPLLSVPAL